MFRNVKTFLKMEPIYVILLGVAIATVMMAIVIFYNRGKPCGAREGKPCKGEGYKTSKGKPFIGICYFDIDGTLTTASGDREKMVQECLDRGYAVGVSTASARTIEDICRDDLPAQGSTWMPYNLCKFMYDHNFDTYNSATPIVGGIHAKDNKFPITYPHLSHPGIIKAYGMNLGREIYKIADERNIILFDDDPDFIKGVKSYGRNFTTVCSGEMCAPSGQRRLTLDIVRNTLDELV